MSGTRRNEHGEWIEQFEQIEEWKEKRFRPYEPGMPRSYAGDRKALVFAGALIAFSAFRLFNALSHENIDVYPLLFEGAVLAFGVYLVISVIQRRRRL